MADHLEVSVGASSEERYAALIPQLRSLLQGEPNLVANLANVSAALFQTFGWHWVGFYLVDGNELVLGPFQGPVACTRIARGKGVCGTSWEKAIPLVVGDVELFEGHIACSPLSRSEIVVPLVRPDGVIWGVLDADSTVPDHFDQLDLRMLGEIASLLTNHHFE